MEPQWLEPDELTAWKPLLGLGVRLVPMLEADLAPLGLTLFEYMTLARLGEQPDRSLTMSSLAALAMGSQSRLSHVARRLEGRGLIERTAHCGDRRAVVARLTDAGWRLLQDAAPVHVASVRRHVIDPLGPDLLAALGEAAWRIAAADDPSLPEHVPDVAERWPLD